MANLHFKLWRRKWSKVQTGLQRIERIYEGETISSDEAM